MPENPRIQIPFGGGLEREAGVMVMRPGSFEDQRNVFLREGKAIVRPGFDSPLLYYDDVGVQCSHVLQGCALRSERVGIVVTYQQSSEKVFVQRVNAEGTIAELIGEWVHDRGGWGASPPVISMAEVYGRVFMAQDERSVLARAGSIYYDSLAASGPLNDLEADFEGSGAHKLRFRGVARHLVYLAGWGYGDESEDRPDYLRISRPDDPTTFDPTSLAAVGEQRDGIRRGISAAGGFIIFKEAEAHVLRGTSHLDFGVFPLDEKFGILAGGLATEIGNGVVLAWSAEGPRAWDGQGPSRDLAPPLDLDGFEPSSLVAQGDTDHAFAHYVPVVRVAIMVFGQRAYVIDVRKPSDWRWAGYWPLGFTPYCAFTLYTGTQLATAPVGYPEFSAAVVGGSYADLTVYHHDITGDETVETWIQELPGGTWVLADQRVVSLTNPHIIDIDGLTGGSVTYNVAFRYRRGALYESSYQSSDPLDWPVVSRGQITTGINAPTIVSAVWSRVDASNEKVTVTITPASGQEANDIEVFRDGVSIGTITGPHAGDVTIDDTTSGGLGGETEYEYTAVTKGTPDSPPSLPVTAWTGPTGVPVINWVKPWQGGAYQVDFTTPDPSLPTEVWDNNDAGGLGFAFSLRGTALAGETQFDYSGLTGASTTEVKVRQKESAFGVDDYSEFSNVVQVVISP